MSKYQQTNGYCVIIVIFICFLCIELIYYSADYKNIATRLCPIETPKNSSKILCPVETTKNVTNILCPVETTTTMATDIDITNVSSSLKQTDYDTTGFPIDIVPNIVHYILFRVHEIEFAHFISMVSVLKNHRPDLIYIHCDCTELYGDNWHRVQAIANRTGTRLTVRPIEIPTQVFGKNLSEGWRLWHASDVSRLQVLQEFGGIYLDRDVYVIKPFNEFFKYEMTIDFESQNTLGSQVLIGRS